MRNAFASPTSTPTQSSAPTPSSDSAPAPHAAGGADSAMTSQEGFGFGDDKKTFAHDDKPHDYAVAVELGSASAVPAATDAVFGDLSGGGPDYRSVSWGGSCVLMMKANVGLGVLSLPVVMQTLGMVPGLILIVTIQAIVTWANYNIGTFKIRHPEVYSLSDAGRIIWGPIGGEILGVVFSLYMIFVSGSAIIAVSVALNAVSLHGTCTAVFVACSAIAGFLLSSIPTLGQITWLGWIGVVSIFASILTLTVAVGVQDRPSDAPAAPLPWDANVQITASPVFAAAMTALGSVLFSAAATPTFFGIVSEMRDPREYPKALLLGQTAVTVFYVVIASVVYAFCGQYVATPALGSAGPLFKRISYGIAIPALLVSLTLYTHIPAKYVFVRTLRNRWRHHLARPTKTHWAVWLACTAGCTLIAYIIASGIPVFGSLISFVGAVFCPMVCMIPYMFMWFHDHPDWRTGSVGTRIVAVINMFIIVAGIFLTVAGTYGSVVDLISAVADRPWSCADNSV